GARRERKVADAHPATGDSNRANTRRHAPAGGSGNVFLRDGGGVNLETGSAAAPGNLESGAQGRKRDQAARGFHRHHAAPSDGEKGGSIGTLLHRELAGGAKGKTRRELRSAERIR